MSNSIGEKIVINIVAGIVVSVVSTAIINNLQKDAEHTAVDKAVVERKPPQAAQEILSQQKTPGAINPRETAKGIEDQPSRPE
jgi:hypothetical protein